MPVSGQRDPRAVKAALEPWLQQQLPDATDVTITQLVVPEGSGFSNETFLLDVSWTEGGDTVAQPMVLRSQPQEHEVFPEIDVIEQQYLTMKLLGEHSDVPVPRVRWAEAGHEVLGRPFFVMDRLTGDVPADVPPYLAEGFVVDMDADTRHRWHRNALEALTRVGRTDWRAAGFAHLDKARHGALGPEQRQGYLAHFLDWATKGEHHPVAHPAWERLVAQWPDDGQRIELCWGDARVGNQMFRGAEVIGVFDWEMVSLGNSESDLGWWLFVEQYQADGYGLSRLEGMLDDAETVAEWEHHMGRPAEHIEFYRALGGFQFTLVMIRLSTLLGMPDMAVHNPVAYQTADLLGIPRPG